MQSVHGHFKPLPTILWTGGLTTTLAEQYTKELDIESENKELKLRLRSVVDEVTLMKDQIKELINAVNSIDQNTKNQIAKHWVKTGLFK
jgi:hypothetical protein